MASKLLVVVGCVDDEDRIKKIVKNVGAGIEQWIQPWPLEEHEELVQTLNSIPSMKSIPNRNAEDGTVVSRYRGRILDTTVLINPAGESLHDELVDLFLTAPSRCLIVFGGFIAEDNADWLLQDGLFSLCDFREIFGDSKVTAALSEHSTKVTVCCCKHGFWETTEGVVDPLSKITFEVMDYRSPLPHDRSGGGDNLNDTDFEKQSEIEDFTSFLEDGIGNEIRGIFSTLKPPHQEGFLKIRKPCLYVFPGGNGDSAFFAVNGFNMLVNGGACNKPWFWKLIQHVDRVDSVLATHLGCDNLPGLNSLLLRKLQERQVKLPMDNTTPEYQDLRRCLISPDLGPLFINAPTKFVEELSDNSSHKAEGKSSVDLPSAEGNPLSHHQVLKTVNVVKDTMRLSKALHMEMLPLIRKAGSIEPLALFSKIGLGRLELYVLNPVEGSKEMTHLNEKWGCKGKTTTPNGKTGVFDSSGTEGESPITNLSSICALLVWHPSDPNEKIVRVLFPGNASQAKIFEGMETLKNLPFMKMQYVTKNLISKQKPVGKTNGMHPPQKMTRPTSTVPGARKPAAVASKKAVSASSGTLSKRETAAASKVTEKKPKAERPGGLKASKALVAKDKIAPSKLAKATEVTTEKTASKSAPIKKPATARSTSAGIQTKPDSTKRTAAASLAKASGTKAKQSVAVKVSEKSKKLPPLAPAKLKMDSAKTAAKKSSKSVVKNTALHGKVSPEKEKTVKKSKKPAAQAAAPTTPPEDLTVDFANLDAEKENVSKPLEPLSVGSEEPTTSVLSDRRSPEGEDGFAAQYAESLSQNEVAEKSELPKHDKGEHREALERNDDGFIVVSKPEISKESDIALEDFGTPIVDQWTASPMRMPITTSSEEGLMITAQPEEDVVIAAQIEENMMIAAQHQEDIMIATQPDEDAMIAVQPQEDMMVATQPEEDVMDTTQSDEDMTAPPGVSMTALSPKLEDEFAFQDELVMSRQKQKEEQQQTEKTIKFEDTERHDSVHKAVERLPTPFHSLQESTATSETSPLSESENGVPAVEVEADKLEDTDAEAIITQSEYNEGEGIFEKAAGIVEQAMAPETIASAESEADLQHDEQELIPHEPSPDIQASDALNENALAEPAREMESDVHSPYNSSVEGSYELNQTGQSPPPASAQETIAETISDFKRDELAAAEDLEDPSACFDAQPQQVELNEDPTMSMEAPDPRYSMSTTSTGSQFARMDPPFSPRDQSVATQLETEETRNEMPEADRCDEPLGIQELPTEEPSRDGSFEEKYLQQDKDSSQENFAVDAESGEPEDAKQEPEVESNSQQAWEAAEEDDNIESEEKQFDLHASQHDIEEEVEMGGFDKNRVTENLQAGQAEKDYRLVDFAEGYDPMAGSVASSAQDQAPDDHSEATSPLTETADASEAHLSHAELDDNGPNVEDYEQVESGAISKSDLSLPSPDEQFALHGDVAVENLADDDAPKAIEEGDDVPFAVTHQPDDIWQLRSESPQASPTRYHPAHTDATAPLADTSEVVTGVDQLRATELDSPLDVNAKPFTPKRSIPANHSLACGAESSPFGQEDAFREPDGGDGSLNLATVPISPQSNNNPFMMDLMASSELNPFNHDEPLVPPARDQDPCAAQDKTSKAVGKKATQGAASARKTISLTSPVYVDLAYVPNHGNKNSVGVEFFKKIRAKYYVISGNDQSRDEPSADVFNHLLEGKRSWFSEPGATSSTDQNDTNVTVIPTHDTQTVRGWYKQNFKELESSNIHMVASGSKVMVQVESIEACKIEF